MKEFLKAVHPITDDVLDEYLALWTEVKFSKGDFITREGETEKYLYYITEGVQRSYYVNDGKEHTIAFAYAPSFSGIPDSFFTQQPSKDFLQCITDCKMMRISYENQNTSIERHREIETLFRKLGEQFLAGVLQRQHELMADNAETRFRKFAERSPHLFQLVPHKHIASYLKIDHTNFSKLFNNIKF